MPKYQRVSTHSRPKAAGPFLPTSRKRVSCFNTQPPEGGWQHLCKLLTLMTMFQHTAARRRLALRNSCLYNYLIVSTHSRPKAAGKLLANRATNILRFNTQPPEGGWMTPYNVDDIVLVFQHTAARRRLGPLVCLAVASYQFQHTAARRRLVDCVRGQAIFRVVSTHSRPKAAGFTHARSCTDYRCFNTQPPEGGWQDALCRPDYP